MNDAVRSEQLNPPRAALSLPFVPRVWQSAHLTLAHQDVGAASTLVTTVTEQVEAWYLGSLPRDKAELLHVRSLQLWCCCAC